MPVYQLPSELVFPDPREAEENGLLAIGGDLEPERLLLAYRSGIFPWYEEGVPILWHSPDPRCILYPADLRITKSFKQSMRNSNLQIHFDQNFESVIRLCAAVPRKGQEGTWITDEMIVAYCKLHELGIAHSVEAYQGSELVGGLYGLALGKVFCGESMFSLVSNASKLCLAALCGSFDWTFIDCQIYNEHLGRMGATEVSRNKFLEMLKEGIEASSQNQDWTKVSSRFPIET